MASTSAVSVRGFFGLHHGGSSGSTGRSSQTRSRTSRPSVVPTPSTAEDAEGAFRRQRVQSFVQASIAQLDAIHSQAASNPSEASNPTIVPVPTTSISPDDPALAADGIVSRPQHRTAPNAGPAPQRPELSRIPTFRSRRASTATARTEFSTSSAINRGYSTRIEIDGKVRPLPTVPKRNACQTTAFLERPASHDMTYRPGDDIQGAVHLARSDPERGVITGIKARIRGELETSVFGVGESSYYSGDNENGIARRQILFFSEQQTLCQKADIDSGTYSLQQSGLVDHGRKNNLAVPFKFVLPLKIQATALDLLDNKFKASYKRGKKYVDLPPSMDMETRYEPPKATQLFDKAKERYTRQHLLRPMARIKYEIDIIVSRQRLGSHLLPPKRGERLILSFEVSPYPIKTAALPVPNMDAIRLRRMNSSASGASNVSEEGSTPGAEEEEDSWVRDLGGFRPVEEVFGALPRELGMVRTRSQSSVARAAPIAAGPTPKVKRHSTVKIQEGLDGRMMGWLTHTVETDLGEGIGMVEAILSVPATAAFYMETKVPFSLELRLPSKVGHHVEPNLEMSLVRSVLTFSRLGTLTVEKEDPHCLKGFSGPESWSERIRILGLKRQPDDQLPPFYERGRTRQMFGGDFVINRYERVLTSSPLDSVDFQGNTNSISSTSYGSKTKPTTLVPELRLVTPSFSFKALRVEYRLHINVALTRPEAEEPVIFAIETPPVLVAGSQGSEPAAEDEITSSVEDLLSGAPRQSPAQEVFRDGLGHGSDWAELSPGTTPLARTPRPRSPEGSVARPGGEEVPEYSPSDPTDTGPEADDARRVPHSRFEFPSLASIPDEPEVDEEEELNEQIALGLISHDRLAAIQAHQVTLRSTNETRAETLLPSYGDSSGVFE